MARNTQHHRLQYEEILNAIPHSYGYLIEVARIITKIRQAKHAQDSGSEEEAKRIPPVTRDAVNRAIKRFDKETEEKGIDRVLLKEFLTAEEENAIDDTGYRMQKVALDGDMSAMKFVLDRRGGDKWRKEETVNVKGDKLVINITEEEEGL